MFCETGWTEKRIEDNLYSYKDVKIILAYKASEEVVLSMEIQFILEPILDIKNVLHQFQDITRTNFQPVRLEFMNQLLNITLEINKDGYKGWNEIQPMYQLTVLAKRFKPFVLGIKETGQEHPELNQGN